MGGGKEEEEEGMARRRSSAAMRMGGASMGVQKQIVSRGHTGASLRLGQNKMCRLDSIRVVTSLSENHVSEGWMTYPDLQKDGAVRVSPGKSPFFALGSIRADSCGRCDPVGDEAAVRNRWRWMRPLRRETAPVRGRVMDSFGRTTARRRRRSEGPAPRPLVPGSSWWRVSLLFLLAPALCGASPSAGVDTDGRCGLAISPEALLSAFSDVFGVHDVLDPGLAASGPLAAQALRQLDQLGVPRRLVRDGNASVPLSLLLWPDEDALAGLLMRAALGNLVLGLRDPSDWSVVVADVSTGQLVRRRSFSAIRLAVIESLLLIAIVALGRAVWVYKS